MRAISEICAQRQIFIHSGQQSLWDTKYLVFTHAPTHLDTHPHHTHTHICARAHTHKLFGMWRSTWNFKTMSCASPPACQIKNSSRSEQNNKNWHVKQSIWSRWESRKQTVKPDEARVCAGAIGVSPWPAKPNALGTPGRLLLTYSVGPCHILGNEIFPGDTWNAQCLSLWVGCTCSSKRNWHMVQN